MGFIKCVRHSSAGRDSERKGGRRVDRELSHNAIGPMPSHKTVGNDVTKAEDFATEICDVTYPYLLGADKSEYSEEVYFAARPYVVSLQKKIEKKKDECSKSKMDCTECINHISPFISRAALI